MTPKPQLARVEPPRPKLRPKEMAVTLIAGIKTRGGLVLAADTEEIIQDALRSEGQKLHIVRRPIGADWSMVIAGAGFVDYIGMARDLIAENLPQPKYSHSEIVQSVRKSVRELWEHARFEQGVDLKLLIGSHSSDGVNSFTVVSGAAVRPGRNLEAMGIGDAAFRALSDRYLNQADIMSAVTGDTEAIRMFVIYAALQTKASVPGVGKMTQIMTLLPNGEVKIEKEWKIVAVEKFFSDLQLETAVRLFGPYFGTKEYSVEWAIRELAKSTVLQVKRLKREIQRIEEDPSLR